MTPVFSKLKTHFTNWREWELNPVVVKELRQAVRSWAVSGMLLLFLVVLFCTSLVFLISQSFQVNADERLGASVFQAFIVILTGASLAFIPLYVGIRLAVERQESNIDLLYISTLSPGRIIRGKFMCGGYMAVLFFSACMPFMTFTNLLRGVDLPTIFLILFFLFLVVCAAVQVAIFLACLPISRPFKVLIALVGIGFALSVVLPLILFSGFMMHSGVGSMFVAGGPDFWIAFFTSCGVGLAIFFLLYFLSVALISPPSANRALPVRTYVTLIWLLGAVVCFWWMWRERDARMLRPWAIATFAVLAVSMTVVISNYDQISLRVHQKIPDPLLKRAPAFLFFNGAAGGLLWLALLTAATFFVTWLFLHKAPAYLSKFSTLDPDDLKDFDLMAGTVLFYQFAYGLAALFIQRKFLGRFHPRLAGVLFVLLPALCALVPNILFFFLNRLSWQTVEGMQLGNIFNIFVMKNDKEKITHLVFAACCFLVLLVLNARWFVRQVKQFQPLHRLRPPIIAEEPVPPAA